MSKFELSNRATRRSDHLRVSSPIGHLLFLIVSALVVLTVFKGLTAVSSAAISSPLQVTLQARVERLGFFCGQKTAPKGVQYADCYGQITSFDGLKLSVRIKVPAAATAPVPALLSHPAWSSNRGEWDANSRVHFGPVWFVSQGYAAIEAAARGFGGSCGGQPGGANPDTNPPEIIEIPKGPDGEPYPCAWGYTHYADREFETRDSQQLLGVLVDHGIADPSRLAATGGSYGGGQTWLLATSLPWDSTSSLPWDSSPKRGQKLQLAAAIPMESWTDAVTAAVPNGRATDEIDQSASLTKPFGVLKASGGVAAHLLGRTGLGKGNFNNFNPEEQHSYFDGWMAFFHKGEPYETSNVAGITADAMSELNRRKSAFYAEEYFSALSTGAITAVPILVSTGWTDVAMTPVQTLQMYRKLRAAKADYPIYMFFRTSGHGQSEDEKYYSRNETLEFDNQVNLFLDAIFKGNPIPDGVACVFSYPTLCPLVHENPPPEDNPLDPVETPLYPDPAPTPVIGTDWDSVRAGTVRLRSDQSRSTSSVSPNAAGDVLTDPAGTGGKCTIQIPGTYNPSTAWTWPVHSGGLTLLGLPTVKINYVLSGTDATVIAKLWEAAPDGTRNLVTRGVYRLLGPGLSSGTINFQLFGNHWKFHEGNSIQLELSQTDAPFLRPNNLSSSIVFSSPELTLPTVEGFSDLLVTNITASNNRAREGEKVTLTATIANTGTADAGPSQTDFLLDGATVLGLVETPAIPAGGTATVLVQWRTAGVKGEHTVRITADTTNLVAESNEGNNAAARTMTVKGNQTGP